MRRELQTVLLVALFLISPPADAAVESLRDLTPLQVVVRPVDADAKRAHLDEAKLRATVEAVLKDAGIAFDGSESQPTFEVTVMVLRTGVNRTASVRVAVRDWVKSSRQERMSFLATVWEKGTLISASNWKLEERVRQELTTLTQEFVRLHREANT